MVELKQEPQKLTAFLSGELDHHHAKEIREAIDFAVREQYPPVLILDFKQVSFMDSSGIGMMIGITLKSKDAHDVMLAANDAGLLILTAKEKVRLLPPLTITKEEMDAALAILRQVLA